MKKYDSETSLALAKNVFVTGAPAQLPGLKERIACDLVSLRPFKTESEVKVAKDPANDSFRGMQKFARDYSDDKNVWITKADYEENGPTIFRKHFCSNV